MADELDMAALAALLEEQLHILLGQIFTELDTGADSAAQWSHMGVRSMEAEILAGTGALHSVLDSVSGNPAASADMTGGSFANGFSARGNQITQNIYLRENDPSPYQTARAIRRESEAMLRI